MRKLFGLLVLAALVFGVAGTALAENGTIDPFSVRSVKRSNGTISPM